MAAFAVALSAVQVLTGLQATAESTRHGAVVYEFASSYALPPENLLTAIVPGLFGDGIRSAYMGRWKFWEVSLFMGIIGLALAIYGAFRATTERRQILVTMILILLILALGANTPLFRLLYDYAPGFNKFRAHARFNYPLSLFMALLAASGYDSLLKSRKDLSAAIITLLPALLFGSIGLYLRFTSGNIGDDGMWDQVMSGIMNTGQGGVPPAAYQDVNFVNQARHFAGTQCLIASGVLLCLTALFFCISARRKLVHVLAVLGVIEVFVFARSMVATFDLATLHVPAFDRFLASHPGDYRILEVGLPNIATISNCYEIGGYDPAVLGRYSEWMTFLQGQDPNTARETLRFTRFDPLFAMLRCQYGITPEKNGVKVSVFPAPLPHLLLINTWRQIKDRDSIFKAMTAAGFDPRHLVILETPPMPPPVDAGPSGTVRLIDSTSDTLTIEADLPHPAILLITDTYSSSWHAEALPGSSQESYQVLPADYTLRAIPLAVGKHRLRMEYLPAGYRIGLWISLGSTVLYLLLGGYFLVRGSRLAVQSSRA